MITRFALPFAYAKKVFRRDVSEAAGETLSDVQPDERVIGTLKGLAPFFHSQLGQLQSRRRFKWKGSRQSKDDLMELFYDCMWESIFSEYPATALMSSVELRKNWRVVECVDSVNANSASVLNPLIDTFFPMLTDIMNGLEVYPAAVLKRKIDDGFVVGSLTDPIGRQLCILCERVQKEYAPEFSITERQSLQMFADLPTRQWTERNLLRSRMKYQLSIIKQLVSDAMKYQGFDYDLYQEFASPDGRVNLSVNPNWDIVIDER